MKFVLFLLVATGLLFGCGSNSEQQVGRYTIATGSDGKMIRMDTKTGEVITIDKSNTKLIVNTFYEAEDGQVFKYIGKGKLEQRPPLPPDYRFRAT